MRFEWDETKNRSNIAKHGISFDQAKQSFEGVVLTAISDSRDYGEVREVSIGMLGGMAIITVAHMDRNGVTRIISARPASRKERQYYEEALRQTL